MSSLSDRDHVRHYSSVARTRTPSKPPSSQQVPRPLNRWKSYVNRLDNVKLIGNTLIYLPEQNTSAGAPEPTTLTHRIDPSSSLKVDLTTPTQLRNQERQITPVSSPKLQSRHSVQNLSIGPLSRRPKDRINDAPTTSTLKELEKHKMNRNPNRASKWATAAEMRGERNHGENSIILINKAAGGFDNPVGDQEYNLADWSGDWAPAPVDWEERGQYVDSMITDRINSWLKRCDISKHTVYIGNKESTIVGDIAPRSWILSSIEKMIPDAWCTMRMPSELETIDDNEPLNAPWWHNYAMGNTENLLELHVPSPPLDPADNDMSTAMQQTSQLNILKAQNMALKKAMLEKSMKAQQQARDRVVTEYTMPPNQYAPLINLYIRPATLTDMPQIREIWNYYIAKTIFCPEIQVLTAPQVRTRWEDMVECHLPFIVAIDGSSKGNRRHVLEGSGRPRSEPILGFAFADDYNDIKGMYRYTVEIETFVKPNMLHKGVGRCLLDKLMSVLDPCYDIKGGYEFFGDDLKYAPGGRRIIGSIIINIPYDAKDKTRAVWLKQWLSSWQFEQTGEFFEVGHKLSTEVNQMILIKKTGNTIRAGAP